MLHSEEIVIGNYSLRPVSNFNNWLPKPIIKAKASSQYSKELIDIQLARTDLPENQRKYLEQLKERKYGSDTDTDSVANNSGPHS